MARNYAMITTNMWRPDGTFRRLPAGAQRTYLLLVTQSGISAAGTLDLTVRRWADMACDTTPQDITRDLRILQDARFLVVDEDTEEVLVRRFIFDDGGWRNSKRRPVIVSAGREARSQTIRAALSAEFRRLGLPVEALSAGPGDPEMEPDSPSDSPSDRASDSPSDSPSDPEPVDNSADEAFPQVDRASDSPSDGTCRFDRVVVTVSTTDSNPQPSTLNPQPAPPAAEPQPEGEGDDPEATAEAELIAEVIRIRPEWSPGAVSRALAHEDVVARPWPLVAAAMVAIAEDPRSEWPGRIRGQGPWWVAAARACAPAPRQRPTQTPAWAQDLAARAADPAEALNRKRRGRALAEACVTAARSGAPLPVDVAA